MIAISTIIIIILTLLGLVSLGMSFVADDNADRLFYRILSAVLMCMVVYFLLILKLDIFNVF